MKENGLHSASSKGYYKIVKQILDYYCKQNDNETINLENDLGKTAYDLANENKNEDIVNLLKQ